MVLRLMGNWKPKLEATEVQHKDDYSFEELRIHRELAYHNH